MSKFGFFGVFSVVVALHLWALQSQISQKSIIANPKAKVHRITLSSVVVKKPVVVVPKPVIEPKPVSEPRIEPPKPIKKPEPPKKPKKRKKFKKKKVQKPQIKPPPEPEPIIVPPRVEQVVSPVAQVDTASIRDAYIAHIRTQIKQHLYYPRMAKRMRVQGSVKVSFLVLEDGSVHEAKVLSGKKSLLKKAALKTIKSLNLKALPSELGREMRVTLPIAFNLIKG